MLVDIVNPGWAPVYQSNLTEDVQGYIKAPETALGYPWKHYIGGQWAGSGRATTSPFTSGTWRTSPNTPGGRSTR